MQTIYLDISKKQLVPTLYAKQGDVGRKFKAVLINGGEPYPVPAGSAISVWYSGASGEGNYTDIGADRAVSFSGNQITVELITQMLANAGEGRVCLAINTADGDQIGTWNIPYVCEEVPGYGSDAARDYFTAFSQAVENLPYPDASLSVPGKAADAKAVGDALAGKAPAGYGLGEKPVELADAHRIDFKSGFYAFTASTKNMPSGMTYGSILVKCKQSNQWTLEAVDVFTGIKAQCYYNADDGYSKWEYVNPPMKPNAEYRTTERHNGKPVYKKLICYTHSESFSADAGETATIDILHGCTDMQDCWVARAFAGNYLLPFVTVSEGTWFILGDSAIHLSVSNAGWETNYTFNFVLAYTKTTD